MYEAGNIYTAKVKRQSKRRTLNLNLNQSIYSRDAAWETEDNAFHELMERPNRCNAEKCICPDGRESDTPTNELLNCETCGSNCIHKNCWQRKEPYYCCDRVNFGKNASRRPDAKKKKNFTAQKDEIIMKIQSNKRKREHQTDDEKLDEKRRKKRKLEKIDQNPTTPETTNKKRRRTQIDARISSNFPEITKIRNGTFDEILRFTPRVLLYPLSLDQFNNSSKKIAESSNSDRPLVTSNEDNNSSKTSSDFTVISPKKKNGGKSFKNYMITSFFKPFLSKQNL